MIKLKIMLSCAAIAACGQAVMGTPYFQLDSELEWRDALGAGQVQPMLSMEWSNYMTQWNAFLVEGVPYPSSPFVPPVLPQGDLYVYGGGGGGGGGYPEDAGLVMVWQPAAPGEYSSAWKYEYALDPDLSNATITVTVTAPQWGLNGQINNVSFGIRDAGGAIRSWQWLCGPGNPIPWGVPTAITITPSVLGVNAATPVASGFMNNPAFNIVQSMQFIVDENGRWVGGPLPVPPPGAQIPAGLWNYWHNLIVQQQQPAFKISCEGTESTGGGVNNYEYMLINNSAAPILVTVLEVASNDPNMANYTNWTMPPGFVVQLTPNTAYWMAQVKTPHGGMSPGWAFMPPVYVQWASPAGGVNVPPGGTLGPFGFDHPWRSADAEWMASGMGGGPMTVAQVSSPVAGPIGVYTDGPVHAPYMEQQQELLDFGDAPDSPVAVGYPTLLINNGARHGPGAPILGPNPGGIKDLEPDGQPTVNADGDDLNPAGADDEDGAVFQAGPLIPGQMATVTVSLVGPFAGAFLSAWVDFNGDNSWAQLGDQIFVAQPLNPGPNVLAFPVPATAKPNITTYARFRVHTNPGGVAFTGYLPYGEVEDYTVKIGQEMQHEFEFGDAPEGALAYPATGTMGMFPTCITVLPASWIQHTNFGAWLGPAFDLETDGNAGLCPGFNPYDADECFADGDAGLRYPPSYTINAVNSVVLCPNAAVGPPLGQPCTQAIWGANIDLEVHNHMPSQTVGFLNVLIDWDQNGQWGGASQCPGGILAPEHVLVDFPIPNPFDGLLSALGPPSFLIGPNICHVWMRVTITEQPVAATGLAWDGSGSFEDGETEDYLINAGPPLTIVSAMSRKTHGTSGTYDRPSGSIEGRKDGPTRIVTTFNQPIQRLFQPGGDVTVSSGVVGAITIGAPPNNNVLTVDVTGVADKAIFRIGYPGIAAACDATQTTAASKCWYVLIGDVNNMSPVNALDILAIRGALNQVTNATNFTKDLNLSGKIDSLDILFCRGKLNNAVGGVCNP